MAVSPSFATTCWTKTNRQASRPKNSLNQAGAPSREVQNRRPLERVLTDVVDFGHVRRDLGAGPTVRLVVELVLEVVHPHRAELRASEVENLMASGGTFALEQSHLVITVQMVLVGPVAELHALEELVGDVRIARGVDRRWGTSPSQRMIPFSTVPA